MAQRFLTCCLTLALLLGIAPLADPAHAATRGPLLYALMTSSFFSDDFGPAPQSAIEIVDLSTGRTVRTLQIGIAR